MDPKDPGAPPGEAGMVVENLMAMVVMGAMVVMEDMDGGIVMKVMRAKKFQLFL